MKHTQRSLVSAAAKRISRRGIEGPDPHGQPERREPPILRFLRDVAAHEARSRRSRLLVRSGLVIGPPGSVAHD
jgi:hypothetical protein